MSNQFRYFNLGYPDHPALPVYAIYQPTLNCFINTVADVTVAQQLRRVLSSRYQCHVVCLNTADNYRPNLVDNDVCEHWTLQDPAGLIDFDRMDTSMIISADHLTPVTNPPDWPVDQEKAWCFLCQYWLIFLQRFRRRLSFADGLLRMIPRSRPDKFDYYHYFEKEIMHILYTERDLGTADQKIRRLIADDNTDTPLKAAHMLQTEEHYNA